MSNTIKYKNTNLEWCPQIPENWEMKKLKYLVKLRDETIQDIDFKIAVENIESGTGKLVGMDEDKNFQGSLSKFYKNDIIFNKLRPYLHKVYFAEKDGGLYGELLILISNSEILPKFLYYKIFDKHFINIVDGSTQGSKMPRANWEGFIKELSIAFPNNTPEQQKIATFLDEKTAQIDTIITKKQKLIECLKEERMAVINEAVTKGLHQDFEDERISKMNKNEITSNKKSSKSYNPINPVSDILGEIPTHWEVKKLKYVVSKIGSGVTPSGGAAVYLEEGIPLLRSQNIYNDGLRLDDVAYISEEIDANMKNSRISDGDVLLNVTGASIGRCYFIPTGFGKGNVNQHVCIIRPISNKIHTEFLYLIMISNIGQLQIDLQQTGANREGLNFEQIKNFVFPLISLKEQSDLVSFIKTQTKKIDKTISKIQQEIELIKEYKTSLINEVVTGKYIIDNE